jgi:TPR repeat protein/uncharacterized caspase-like protein
MFLAVLIGCQTATVSDQDYARAMEGYNPQDTDKLFVVDCLLPGQIRKLGSQITYISPRRPVKTTAGNCEIRGGEYVAYDRANADSALNVWLNQAKQGDVEAQVAVGEIYQKGLGRMPEPARAAEWYGKAAEQGNARAQINLGYLYEKGLGVKQDKMAAVNWYRKASGLDKTGLQFFTVGDADYQKKLEALRQESQAYKSEAEELRAELAETKQLLNQQKRAAAAIEKQLAKARDKLAKEKGKTHRNQQLIESLQHEVEINQESLNSQHLEVSKLERKLRYEVKQIRQPQSKEKTDEQKKSVDWVKQKAYESELKSLRQQLEQTRQALTRQKQESLTAEKELNLTRKKLNQEKGKVSRNEQLIKSLQTEMESKAANLGHQQQKISALEKQLKDEVKKASDKQQGGPLIKIIEPDLSQTRGEPVFRLRSVRKTQDIIGQITAVSGLKSLTINKKNTQIDADGHFRSEVAIDKATTAVTIIAVDKQNQRSTLNFNLMLPTQEATLQAESPESAETETSPLPARQFGSYYALVIGNNDYAYLPNLKTSVNDAKAVSELLKTRYGYNITLLLNANRHQMMTALNALRNQLTETDNLLIYYAGHGDIDKANQNAYWLPIDAEPNNTANWLSNDNITEYLNVIAAKHILVIADSCYAGAMSQTSIVRLPKEMPEDKKEKWLNFMMNRKARTVMTSGGVEPVLDSGSGNHSIFASALLKALKANKGLMVDYELYRMTALQVKKSASLVGFQQMPQYSALQHAGHEGSPFFFIPNS